MWVFGYGSLIFRPGFAFEEKRPAYIVGYARRFWQGSPDHRGTPEMPGRVVTLIAAPGHWVGGVAYRIGLGEAETILSRLDTREIAGFVRVDLPLHDRANGDVFATGTTWIAGSDNAHYLGELPEAEIAAHIAKSHGPSGANRDYALSLAAALRELAIADEHVDAIAKVLETPSLGTGPDPAN